MESMENKHRPYGLYERYFKRLLDILCGLAAVIVFWWLYIIIAILIRVKLGSPVIFKQPRPGKDERIFNLYKFRTMTDARDEHGNLLPDDQRLTKFGCSLRASSMDELPEVFNIIKGDMSIIGPRPLLVQYLPLYSEEQRHRHDVLPGLSGYAQVHGRNAISWGKKFEYDCEYVKKITFWGDVKILVQTIGKAFIQQEGISSGTCGTMEDFDGTN